MDDISHPPKVKIEEGVYHDHVTCMHKVTLQGLNLKKGSYVFVFLETDRNRLVKAVYRSNA